VSERLQTRLDLGTAAFEEGWERQAFAERFQRFVGGEAGAIGGDFEQDAVGFAEIDEVKQNRSISLLVERPRFAVRFTHSSNSALSGSEGDMVHAAGAPRATGNRG
jgi:hypothetical protein